METPDYTYDPRPGFWRRFSPRASARVQLMLAGSMWGVASVILGLRGIVWLSAEDSFFALLALGFVAGAIKARYLLVGVAERARKRIIGRGRDACAGGFFSWRSWLLVLAMIAIGHALRLTSIPRSALGVLYVAVATALALGSMSFWRGTRFA